MKHRRKGIDIFSLSFLDVISCGFGAVVMLILISKTDVDVSTAGADDISSLLASLIGKASDPTGMIRFSVGQMMKPDEIRWKYEFID